MVFVIAVIPLYSIGFSIYKYNKRFFIFKEINALVLNRTRASIPFTGSTPTVITVKRAKGVNVPHYQAEEVDGVVSYITSHTGPREVVFTFPDLGTYNFLTDRPPLGRFYTSMFSFMDKGSFKTLMHELEDERPKFVYLCQRI